MAQYEKGKLYQISIIDFKQDPDQPRKVIDPEGLEELTASIEKHGIIQPLLFRVGIAGIAGHDPISPEIGIVSQDSVSPNSLIIVAGERRYQAAKKANLTVLPAICVEGNTDEIALVENLQRQDLTAVEEAEALQRLKAEQQYTDEQLSGVIGKARTTISDILLINRLPQAIRDECRGDRQTSKNTLIEIARKKQERGMITAYNAYREKLQKKQQSEKETGAAMTRAEKFIQMIDKTKENLRNTDISNWTEEDKTAAHDALEGLQEAIEEFRNPPDKTLA